jgi:hypothetical protein
MISSNLCTIEFAKAQIVKFTLFQKELQLQLFQHLIRCIWNGSKDLHAFLLKEGFSHFNLAVQLFHLFLLLWNFFILAR